MKINKDDLIVYTSLIGSHEGLNSQPFIKDSEFRHVCLTDDENLKSNDWEIIYVERILPEDPNRSQRDFKIRPHLYFKDYKYSFYIDNTVLLKRVTDDFINNIISDKNLLNTEALFCVPYHSSNNDLISEFNMCSKFDLDNQLRFYEQLNHYVKINVKLLKLKPYWAAILLRNHSNQDIINFSEIWFAHICRYTRRDQLSLIYAANQAKIKIHGININNNNSLFHKWPVSKFQSKNWVYNDKFIDYIPYNLLENLDIKIKENKNLLDKINYENKIRKKIFTVRIINYILSNLRNIIKRSFLFIGKRL